MEPSDDLAVQVASLRKAYGDVVAVGDVSFTVERGSVFCIIGPNGAGKTTTIECLEGLRRQDSGSVLVGGLDPIADRRKFVHRIGVQLQETGIPPRMKVREALRYSPHSTEHPYPCRSSATSWGSMTVSPNPTAPFREAISGASTSPSLLWETPRSFSWTNRPPA